MVDIIKEIEHDIAEEKYQRIFLQHGKKMIIGAVIILVVVALKSIYWYMQNKKSVETGNLYLVAMDDNKSTSYDSIIAKDQKGYSPLAALMKAGLQNSNEKYDEALTTLKQLSAESYDKAFNDMAKLDTAYVLIEKKGDKATILKTLDEVSAEDAPFRATALELKATYLLSQGENKQAAEILRLLASNNEIPSTVQERAKNILSTINE